MNKYQEKLNRIFFGNPPAHLWDIPEDLNSYGFAKQNMQYTWGGPFPDDVYNLNFTTFILDVVLEGIQRYTPIEVPEDLRLKASGLLIRGLVTEWLQEKDISNEQKRRMCFFQRGLLETFTTVYNIKVIDKQTSYIKELIRKERELASKNKAKPLIDSSHIKFQPILSKTQKDKLIDFLLEEKYINSPGDFVEFLCGRNDGRKLVIISGKEEGISYLLYQLYQVNLIKVTSGKGYQKYLESTVCPFSQQKEKGQIKSLVRKVQRNKLLKSTIGKDIDTLIRLIS